MGNPITPDSLYTLPLRGCKELDVQELAIFYRTRGVIQRHPGNQNIIIREPIFIITHGQKTDFQQLSNYPVMLRILGF